MKHLSQNLFAQMIKEKRCAKCMTQEQVSESTGISIDVIGKMERKEHTPSIPELEKLSELLDFSIETLFVDSANPTVCTAHQDKDLSAQDKDGIEHLFEMMLVIKKQIMLRRALQRQSC